MAIAFVQGTGNENFTGSVSTLAQAFGSNITTGSNVYVVGFSDSAVTHTSVTDTRGNTYTKRREFVDTNANRYTYWEAQNSTSGANTVTLTCSGNAAIALVILEYSGARIASASYDTGADVSAGSASTTMNAASVTPSADGALVLAAVFPDSAFGTSLTGTGSYTKRAASGGTMAVQVIDFVQTTAGATTPSGTWASSTTFSASAAVFLPPAAGGGGVAKGTLAFFLDSH